MQHTPFSDVTLTAYDLAVEKAYFKILDFVKQMLASIPAYEARCTLESDLPYMVPCYRHRQFVSPMFHLGLTADYPHRYVIHFGYQLLDEDAELANLSTKFLRALYKFTSVAETGVDIEDCVLANFIITSCSELFDAISESDHSSFVFQEISYQYATQENVEHS